MSKKNYIIFNEEGKILRTGYCTPHLYDIQAQDGEYIMEGKANDLEDKIVDGWIEKKTQAEKDVDKIDEHIREQVVVLTVPQYQDLLSRLEQLEKP